MMMNALSRVDWRNLAAILAAIGVGIGAFSDAVDAAGGVTLSVAIAALYAALRVVQRDLLSRGGRWPDWLKRFGLVLVIAVLASAFVGCAGQIRFLPDGTTEVEFEPDQDFIEEMLELAQQAYADALASKDDDLVAAKRAEVIYWLRLLRREVSSGLDGVDADLDGELTLGGA